MKAFTALFFCALLIGAQASSVTIDDNILLNALLSTCTFLNGGNPCDLLAQLNILGGLYSISNGDSLSITTTTKLNANITAITLASLNIQAAAGSVFTLVDTTVTGTVTVAEGNIALINSTFSAAQSTVITGGAALVAGAGAVVTFSGGLTIDASSNGANQGLVVNGGATVTIGAASTINGAISLLENSTFIITTGTTTIASDLTAYGDTKVQTVLNFASGAYTQAKGNLILATQATVQAVVSASVTIQASAALRGIGNITGNLNVASSNNLGGTIAPGNSPGTVWVNGNFALTSTSTYELDIQDGNTYDRVIVSGTATVDGILYVHLLNGFTPSEGETFTFITSAGTASGDFNVIHGDVNSNFAKFHSHTNDHSVVATYSSATTAAASLFLLIVALAIASL